MRPKYKSPGRREMRALIEASWVWIARGPTITLASGAIVSNNRAARRAR